MEKKYTDKIKKKCQLIMIIYNSNNKIRLIPNQLNKSIIIYKTSSSIKLGNY